MADDVRRLTLSLAHGCSLAVTRRLIDHVAGTDHGRRARAQERFALLNARQREVAVEED